LAVDGKVADRPLSGRTGQPVDELAGGGFENMAMAMAAGNAKTIAAREKTKVRSRCTAKRI